MAYNYDYHFLPKLNMDGYNLFEQIGKKVVNYFYSLDLFSS